MSVFQFQTVSHIISGIGSIQQLDQLLTELNIRRLLLISDAGILQAQLHHPILETVENSAVAIEIYADISADPSEHVILKAVEFAKAHAIDGILALGGGRAMDVAKVVALLAHPEQQQELADLYGIGQAKKPRLPLILVPTTAGTGSEVTPISIVTTGETTKTGIVSSALFADVAILDATFSASLPAHITTATAIDAMVHAIEAYTSKLKKNPYSDMLAKAALRLLNANFNLVLQDGKNLTARQNMLEGAMLAGQAFSNAPVAAVHALAYPLGGHFHVSHGHSNALLLTEVMKFNAPQAKQLYAELMNHLDPKSKGCVDGLTDLFIDHFNNHLQRSGLTLSLRELNIDAAMLPRLAEDAMLQTRLLQNNPRTVQYQDALAIYQAIY